MYRWLIVVGLMPAKSLRLGQIHVPDDWFPSDTPALDVLHGRRARRKRDVAAPFPRQTSRRAGAVQADQW